MDRPEDEIIKFLLDPKNIESALDLAKVVPLAIDELHIGFWDKLVEIVELRLSEKGFADKWKVGLWVGDNDSAEPSDFIRDGGGLELTPGPVGEMPLFWAYWVEQHYDPSPRARRRDEDKLAPIFIGFGFQSDNERRMRQQASALPSWAKNLYDKPGVGWHSDKEFLGYGYVVYDKPLKLRDRDQIIRLAARDDDLEKQIADSLFGLFEKTHEDIETENAKLRASKGFSKKQGHA